jgi:ribonuclease BN (tRNA processing enzyme)
MAEVEVRFLGSGDAFGSGGRFQTCMLVSAPQARFLIDCGASSLVAMKRYGVDPSGIGEILVSHLHGDHFGGIPFFVLDAQFNSRRATPLRIAGPPGIEARVVEAMEVLFPGSSTTKRKFGLEFLELAPAEATELGPVRVTPYEVVHASGAPPYALRIECGGRVIAYSGDTEWTDALIEAARGADLFVCEAYFFERRVRYHLDYRTLAEHRGALGCRRLVVTHMNEDMLRRVEDLDVEAANDGKVVRL